MNTLEMIGNLERQLSWLRQHASILEPLPKGEFWNDGFFDFNVLPHDQVIQVLTAFGGKWNKTVNLASIDYVTAAPIVGYTVRCYMGQPPPACRIEEVEEYVPAQPASVRKVRKLICPEGVTS